MITPINRAILTALSCMYLIGGAGAHAAPPDLDAWFGDRIRTPEACAAAGHRWYDVGRLKGCLKNGTQTGVWEIWNGEETPFLNFLVSKDNDKLNGPAVAFFPTGEIAATMNHRDEKPVGLKTGYWKNGAIRETSIYNDDGSGKLEGPTFKYAPHGAVTMEGNYVDDALDGPYAEWSGGCVKTQQGHYVAGQKDGLWFTWTEKGVLESEGKWEGGQRVGVWKFYDTETGALVQEGPYVEGLRDGTWTEHFANTFKWREVQYEKDKRVMAGVADCESVEGRAWSVNYLERAEGCYVGDAPFGNRIGEWTFYYETGEKRRVETLDAIGMRQGPYLEFHKSGKPLATGAFLGGVPDGEFVWQREDGTELDRFIVTGGTGEWRAYHPDGKPRERGRYEKGQKFGEWSVWFPNGNRDSVQTYVANVEDGPMSNWYDTGEVKATGSYTLGNRSGTWTAYYTNGRVAWRGGYDEEGNRSGLWESYFWEGGLKSKGSMLRDRNDGMWSFYYESGELSAEGSMVQDSREGLWRFYWKNGDVWREVTYAGGVEIGTGQGMCEDSGGTWVQMVDERAAGCQVCRWKPQGEGGPDLGAAPIELEAGEIPEGPSAGNATPPAPVSPDPTAAPGTAEDKALLPHVARGQVIKAQEQAWVFWYPNGKKEKEGLYSKGKSQGLWTFWYENGQIMLRGTFTDGVEDGEWEGFYPNGSKRFAGKFVNGTEDGAWMVFSQKGTRLMEGAYELGHKVGPWVYYDDDGKKRDEGVFEKNEETGVWKAYWPSGALKCEGTYEAGKRTGVWTWSREDGSEWRKATYVDGREARTRK